MFEFKDQLSDSDFTELIIFVLKKLLKFNGIRNISVKIME